MKQLSICICLLFCLTSKAQVNLVPNPSFEDTIGNQCQSQMGISNSAVPIIKNWGTNHSFSTPDYYNTCANAISYPNICTVPYNSRSYQNPHSGNAYIGIGTYLPYSSSDSAQIGTEYISTKLKEVLKPNICYYAEFYANLGNISHLATNQISLLLSQNNFTTSLGSFTNSIQAQVQWDTTQYFTDTLNWVKISGNFIAQGGEQYLTIGNFKDGAHLKKRSVSSNFTPAFGSTSGFFSAYILIEDVSLYELPTPHLPSTIYTLCPTSDSLLLGDTARIQTRYQWYANGNAIDTTSFIKVNPPASTGSATYTYVLKSTNCTTTTQTIVVTYSANCEPVVIVEPTIPNVFTPNADGVNDAWEFSLGKSCTLSGVEVYDRWGLLIKNLELNTNNYILWDGRTTSGIACSDGVYYYTLTYKLVNGDTETKKGFITLIR